MDKKYEKISQDLGVTLKQIDTVLSLTAEGATIPFIARYRKDMTGSLVFGCLFASIVQVYVPTRILTSISATPLLAIVLLMLLSFLLSLCSEADAFIGSSLLSSFGFSPVLAFLVIGPMLDVKNLLMMKNYLKTRFIWQFMTIVTFVVIVYSYIVGVML